MEKAVGLDLMLHAYMFTQSGIPMLYSGDEIGQVNDYSYKGNPLKREDSRYLHRGAFHWDLAAKRGHADTVEGKIFMGLNRLENFADRKLCLIQKPVCILMTCMMIPFSVS